MIILLLFVLGLSMGSFVNALVWRIYQQQKAKSQKQKATNYQLPTTNYSILRGRSMCPNCRHALAVKDLVPVLSWISLKGKCRYCKKPISRQYPAVELTTGLVFAASYYFWPGSVETSGDWLLLITWLLSSIGLLALLIYDYKWMLLPSRILYPTAVIAVVGRVSYILAYESNKLGSLAELILSVVVAGGIFLLIYIVSSGRWIGFGDVRLGLITGTLLASPTLSFLMIFIASLLGTLFVLPDILAKKKTIQAKLPYGPFLIAATAISLLFGQSLIDWYERLLLI